MNKNSILIAEDNRVMADVVRFNLVRAGFEVVVAGDGFAALEIAKSRQFDLVITDSQMPRMKGEEFCAELRKLANYQDVPVIMCSAKGFELNAERLRTQYGIERVLLKPFSPREVLAVVEERLNGTAVVNGL
ncbi:MAG TPA: hypothetical protein DD473_24875 [Planctomycetaceae bacterium]|nr:hypothetical protein [Planctomycetaceae bacterium]|tara:strand:- start:1343 stop:1738 length:396 start_codon:yes stop_codon:yes gene_type:complete